MVASGELESSLEDDEADGADPELLETLPAVGSEELSYGTELLEYVATDVDCGTTASTASDDDGEELRI